MTKLTSSPFAQHIEHQFQNVLRNNIIADIHYKYNPATDEVTRLKFVIVEMHKAHEQVVNKYVNSPVQTKYILPGFVVENKLGREQSND